MGSILSADGFAERFTGASRVLWTVAAAVVVDRSVVDDVLQEAAMVGLQKRDQFEPGTSFSAWMGRIVRFVALNLVRQRRRHRAAVSFTDPEVIDRNSVSGGSSPAAARAPDLIEPAFVMREASFDDDLSRALLELTPTARACLLLRTVLELDYREIAATLGVPEGTAMSHVHRARRRLRRELEPASSGGSR